MTAQNETKARQEGDVKGPGIVIDDEKGSEEEKVKTLRHEREEEVIRVLGPKLGDAGWKTIRSALDS